jgi:uncharacterized protein YaiL (DUF2058 family)
VLKTLLLQEDMQSGAMVVAQQAAKRQRLNHAAQLENERTGRTRALAAKVCTSICMRMLVIEIVAGT